MILAFFPLDIFDAHPLPVVDVSGTLTPAEVDYIASVLDAWTVELMCRCRLRLVGGGCVAVTRCAGHEHQRVLAETLASFDQPGSFVLN